MCFAAGLLATLILLPFVVESLALLDSTPAAAQCAQSGNSENCTGNLSGNVTFTAPPINTLNVNSLNGNLGAISLSGTGSAPAAEPIRM
jgi:hypothetical protein